MSNQLEQLKTMTTVVADTGDFTAIADYSPQDTTTNPSLVLKAFAQSEYEAAIKEAVAFAKKESTDKNQQCIDATDYLSVLIGKQLLSLIPGRNSTEVDARLSFDTQAMVEKARRLIRLYQQNGIESDRVLIKIASTWEGIKAAEILEKEGIQCNLTLLFSFAQARACAEAGVFLISPFVGRILDWFKKAQGVEHIPATEDPGVQSVSEIFNYYKSMNYSTIVMGASFRNKEEILELAGCDRLTISPALLNELAESNDSIVQKLNPTTTHADQPGKMTEADFRWELNQNAMATEKTAEGIRLFATDQVKLEEAIKDYF